MSSGIIETIKKVAISAFEASNPVKLLFGKVISTDPIKIQAGEYLTLTKEFLVINGTVEEGDEVTLIRCQGGQKYVVLGTRTAHIESGNVGYMGGEVTPEMAVADTTWQYPYKGKYVCTSRFGVARGTGKHSGVDLVGMESKHLYPINNGKVVTVLNKPSGYGLHVIVDHGNGYWSLYAHMDKVYVKEGQLVTKNTILGLEGNTGNSTGSHLHLEVRKGGNTYSYCINPSSFLDSGYTVYLYG